jgi:hypothetical protein
MPILLNCYSYQFFFLLIYTLNSSIETAQWEKAQCGNYITSAAISVVEMEQFAHTGRPRTKGKIRNKTRTLAWGTKLAKPLRYI